jgi:hypothetical protein
MIAQGIDFGNYTDGPTNHNHPDEVPGRDAAILS